MRLFPRVGKSLRRVVGQRFFRVSGNKGFGFRGGGGG